MPNLPPLALIAGISQNNVLGHAQRIPWHYPADLRFFRRITVGHAIIMGRTTFLSLGQPLPGRKHFVLSRQPGLTLLGATTCSTLDDALARARQIDPCPFVIGGAQIYALALPMTTLMYLTHIEQEVAGDTFFPPVCWEQWEAIETTQQGPLRFVAYRRRRLSNRQEKLDG